MQILRYFIKMYGFIKKICTDLYGFFKIRTMYGQYIPYNPYIVATLYIDQACVHDGKRRYGEVRGKKVGCLFVLQLSQSSDGGSDRGGGGGGIVPGSTCNLHAALPVLANPDANTSSPHPLSAAEGAHVLGVLRDFHLLHSLPQRSTIPSTVFTGDSHLFRTPRHFKLLLLVK